MFCSSCISEVISASILNKYNNMGFDDLNRNVRDFLKGDVLLFEEVRVDQEKKMFRDVLKQYCFYLEVEVGLVGINLNSEHIKKINHCVVGGDDGGKLRDFDFVKDFGGYALVDYLDIEKELMELDLLLAELVRNIELGQISEEKFLSKVFCEIIRIHPFVDGNGRTARCLINALVRGMGYKYLAIPKYNNDQIWKEALQDGMTGKYAKMEAQFLNGLEKV